MLQRQLVIKILTFVFLVVFEIAFSLTVIAPNGSIVYYDNKLVGIVKDSPLVLNVKLPGEIKIVKPGFTPYVQNITEDGTVTVNLALPSILNVKITPPNIGSYTIYLDGQSYLNTNETLLSFQLGSGKHELVFDGEGFLKKNVTVELLPGEIKSIEVNLKNTVTLNITSPIVIAEAYFDYNKISLPNTIETIPGEHVVHLPGNYVYNTQKFTVPKVDSYSIKINTSTYKKLSVFGEPDSAYVNILGTLYTPPVELNLPEGSYEIEISASGYKATKMSVNLLKDEVIFFTLEPLERQATMTYLEGYKILLDGLPSTTVSDTMRFTTITTDSTNVVVWYGISKGYFQSLPKTIPVIVSDGFEVEYSSIIYKGPAIVQVLPGSKVLVSNGKDVEEMRIEKLTIIDSSEKCVVNIYGSSENDHFDVYWDGVFIGRTPIYFFTSNEGEHSLSFKTSVGTVASKVTVRRGIVNEFLYSNVIKRE